MAWAGVGIGNFSCIGKAKHSASIRSPKGGSPAVVCYLRPVPFNIDIAYFTVALFIIAKVEALAIRLPLDVGNASVKGLADGSFPATVVIH